MAATSSNSSSMRSWEDVSTFEVASLLFPSKMTKKPSLLSKDNRLQHRTTQAMRQRLLRQETQVGATMTPCMRVNRCQDLQEVRKLLNLAPTYRQCHWPASLITSSLRQLALLTRGSSQFSSPTSRTLNRLFSNPCYSLLMPNSPGHHHLLQAHGHLPPGPQNSCI